MARWAYYNENASYPARWLRNLIAKGLIADGYVDERDIRDVEPDDLREFGQCHFFAGIGGWSLALRAAGIDDSEPVWTGSCPCQPFSAAGKGLGFADERHLWPAFHWLIAQCRPDLVFGEQVEGPAGRAWLDLVSTDLEGTGYTCGASVLPAAGVGAPHERHRIFWLAHTNSTRLAERTFECGGSSETRSKHEGVDACTGCARLSNTDSQSAKRIAEPRSQYSHWSVESGMGVVVDGIPDRMERLRATGNAIVPQAAEAFIRAALGR